MEQKIWILRNTYDDKFLAFNDVDALKKTLGTLAFEYWDLNGELDSCFNDTYEIEVIPLNVTDYKLLT